MKLVGLGFSVNGKPNLKGVIEVREDDGTPTGVEWDRDLSNEKQRALVINQLQEEFFVTEDKARLQLRELIKELQQARTDTQSLVPDEGPVLDTKPEMSARFSGLVDLVEQRGEIQFIVIEDDTPSGYAEFQAGDKLLVPPPKDTLQWLLPSSSAVFHYYRHDNDLTLYNALLDYFKNVSQLPSDLH